jgi:hypothetical protein
MTQPSSQQAAPDLDPTDAARTLWEIEQIKQLKARYFRFVDTRDWDGVVALFSADCDLRSTLFPEARRPRDFFPKVASMITPGISVHHGHMPEITLTSWETATGIWAMYDYVQTDDGSVGYRGYGHYHESYRKALTGSRADPVPPGEMECLAAGWPSGNVMSSRSPSERTDQWR